MDPANDIFILPGKKIDIICTLQVTDGKIDVVTLFDFSDSEWHFTLAGAVKIANAYPNTPLLLNHWGSVDAPDFAPFNADPEKLKQLVVNPERIQVLAPGQPYILNRLK